MADRHALDISAALTDARTRASLHFEVAALVGVRLIIDDARPLGPIEITYAKARGRALPGQTVGEKRLRISYDGAKAVQTDDTDRSPAYVLPDPNCPLEAAFRAATQAGAAPHARHFAVYSHSVRHQRPMWTVSAAEGAAYHVDADNCALIVR